MPFAVTLPLDGVAASVVERLWQALAQQGDDDSLRLGYAPHITLAILPDDVAAGAIDAAMHGVAAAHGPVAGKLAGIGIFPATPPVLWAVPVVTTALLGLHKALVDALAPLDMQPHYRPGAWVPHVTLGKNGRLPAGQAADILSAAWTGPMAFTLARMELLRFRPVQVLSAVALPPTDAVPRDPEIG